MNSFRHCGIFSRTFRTILNKQIQTSIRQNVKWQIAFWIIIWIVRKRLNKARNHVMNRDRTRPYATRTNDISETVLESVEMAKSGRMTVDGDQTRRQRGPIDRRPGRSRGLRDFALWGPLEGSVAVDAGECAPANVITDQKSIPRRWEADTGRGKVHHPAELTPWQTAHDCRRRTTPHTWT